MELKYMNDNFRGAYRFFNKWEKSMNTGMLLLIVAVVAIVIANSPWGPAYQTLLATELHLGTESFNFLSQGGEPMTLLGFINDALMAIFFLSVGLEIKREMLVGELSSFRQVLLPFIAACGGMIFPVVVFYFTGQMQSFSPDEMRGMAIPMATDIAFSLGVLSLFSNRVPLSLKVFLLALAIVDDIGGIIVIAIFYSSLSTASLVFLGVAAAAFIILILGGRLKINSKVFYAVFGIVIWWAFLQAGIHPTIAGVIVAFTIPARPYTNLKRYTKGMHKALDLLEEVEPYDKDKDPNDILLTNTEIKILSIMEKASDRVISPLQNIEDSIHRPVNYFIMPLFAFANAGVILNFSGGWSMLTGVSLAVMAGLIIGKPLGIFLFTWLAVKLKVSPMPTESNWKGVFGIALLGGIGFTVALFLASLSYPVGSDLLNQARLGILLGSFISGIIGFIYLNKILPKTGEKWNLPRVRRQPETDQD